MALVTAPASTAEGVPARCDVLVVGAGLAGLAAARTLAASGRHVVVVEQAHRVGGRVGTDVVDGWSADHGFQLLNPTYPALRRYVDVAALRLQPLGIGVVVGVGAGQRLMLADPRSDPGALAALGAAVRSLASQEMLAVARYVARARLLPVRRLETAPDMGWHAAFDAAGLSGPIRRQILEPFLTGTLADPSGTTSRRYVDLVLRSFVTAAVTGSAPGLPVGGMQAFADAVAAPIRHQVVLGARVDSLTSTGPGWRARTTAGEVSADAVIVATESPAMAALLGVAAPPVRALTTFWHISDTPTAPPGRARYLHLDGTGAHRRVDGLVNTAVVSRSAPSYVPPGTATGTDLIATTVIGDRPEAERTAREQAAALLGGDARGWRLLTRHCIVSALPAALPPLSVRAPVHRDDGMIVIGDHRDTPSIQGALTSGRRGALLLLDRDGMVGRHAG